jgi:hypothetical protein
VSEYKPWSDSRDLYAAVRPSAREDALFWRAVRRARALGLTLRPGEVEVRWFRGEDYEPEGVTVHAERPCRVWLRQIPGASDRRLFCTYSHELLHAWDSRNPSLEKPEREARAERFAARAVAAEFGEARDGECAAHVGTTTSRSAESSSSRAGPTPAPSHRMSLDVVSGHAIVADGPLLSTFPRMTPRRDQQQILQRAIAVAQANGLALPRVLQVGWVSAPGHRWGQTWWTPENVTVWLNAELDPGRLIRVSHHELKHASDFLVPTLRQLDPLELDRRALAYTNLVMNHEPSAVRGNPPPDAGATAPGSPPLDFLRESGGGGRGGITRNGHA